ncbi:aminotransferase class V-fold PLP-dependent enzyme [Syntrophomonas palmitatica]|uniref:aminotransferase class V-fold PLP-dependent enzyme n=1 Tax=Syntrophomonas palmitatica TaxID=402877 RepID=UPI001FA7FC94|nr:aminotransferase class V-fold PLP-dependent enzyme [Syntrophomonas palmitatica]
MSVRKSAGEFVREKNNFDAGAFRKEIVGAKTRVQTLKGRKLNYINLDNAASTPALRTAVEEIKKYLPWYSGVHRGTGFKSLISTHAYEKARQEIGAFVGADPDLDTVILLKNTTEAINKLSYRFDFKPGDRVLTTAMEHHSNDLPWRQHTRVHYVQVDGKGRLDINDLEKKLKINYPKVKLLAVCGASNVTGHINDVHYIAQMAHEYKARILVDGAQLVPHRVVNMRDHKDQAHLDFMVFSGHKIYAPFGTGVLIGPYDFFAQGDPEYSGGGTVDMVFHEGVYWSAPPEKDEAGSPNVLGAIGLAASLRYLQKIGMHKLAAYEDELTCYALNRLQKIRGLKIYGAESRVGVISFNIKGVEHGLVGAELCYGAGIGVRNGCFCAQPYVRHLLELNSGYLPEYEEQGLPGMVRISLAAYNTRQEIDYLADCLDGIINRRYELKKQYVFSPQDNTFYPRQWDAKKLLQVSRVSREPSP